MTVHDKTIGKTQALREPDFPLHEERVGTSRGGVKFYAASQIIGITENFNLIGIDIYYKFKYIKKPLLLI